MLRTKSATHVQHREPSPQPKAGILLGHVWPFGYVVIATLATKRVVSCPDMWDQRLPINSMGIFLNYKYTGTNNLNIVGRNMATASIASITESEVHRHRFASKTTWEERGAHTCLDVVLNDKRYIKNVEEWEAIRVGMGQIER